MAAPLFFIIQTLFELYVLTFLLRLVLQWSRADFHNPISQFIVQVTNPIVVPLRRVVPPWRGVDMATVLAILGLELVGTAALFWLRTGEVPGAGLLLYLTVLRTLVMVLRMYVFAVLIYAILSFISPGTYNPVTSVLASICEPVLRPVRRVIPPIAGIDLSPLFVIILLQALLIAIPPVAKLY